MLAEDFFPPELREGLSIRYTSDISFDIKDLRMLTLNDFILFICTK